MKDAVALDSRLYEQVAAHVEALVQHGSLRPGDRVPSLRVLRRQHGVSLATVVRAYRELEARGVIEARPQSGFFARSRPPVAREPAPPRESVASMPASVDALVGRLYDMIRDPNCVPLGAAVPAPSILPMERLNATLAGIARTAGARGATYESSAGPLALRRQLAKRAPSWGCALGPDDFVTTLGATEAMALAIRATTKPGDVVAVESPTYFGFLELLESQGLRALEIPVLPGRGFDVDALGRALGREKIAAVITTPTFNNPTGVCMPDEDKARLVALLASRGIPLIEDDVYGDLAFDGGRPRPAKAFDRDGNVLLCGSVSKTLAAGYRVGWIAPGRFETAVLRMKRANTMEGALLPQLAVAEFFATGAYDRHLRVLRRKLGVQLGRLRAAVSLHFPRGTRMSAPEGGLVLWVELPRGYDARTLYAEAARRRISIAPGVLFASKPRFTRFLRLNGGTPWSDTLEAAVRALGRACSRAT